MDKAELAQSSNSSDDVPPIMASGIGHINLVAKFPVDSDYITEPTGLVLDSIIAQEVIKDSILYRKALPQVQWIPFNIIPLNRITRYIIKSSNI